MSALVKIAKKLVKSRRNTVYTTVEQAENSLDILKRMGVLNLLNERETLIKFLEDVGVDYFVYNAAIDRHCIAEEALKAKAVESIAIMGAVDFAFDKDGKIVGTYTNCRDSFKKRKK